MKIDRTKFIGGSDAAAVIGMSRWQTPLQLWAIKTGQIENLNEETLPQWCGKELEDVVAKRYMIETGKKVRRDNSTIFHKQYPFLACHIDRKVEGEDTILQCKTVSAYKEKEWDGEDIPIEYIIQEYHELACTGYKKAIIACLIGNHKFIIKEIERDEKVLKNLIDKEVYFWREFVEKKVMPGVAANDDSVLNQLFPHTEEGIIIPLPDDVNQICETLESLNQDKFVVEKQIGKLRNELKAMIKEKEIGTTGRYEIKWGNVKKAEHVVKAHEYRQLKIKKIPIHNNNKEA